MNGNEWRDSTPKGCHACGARWPSERLELVERVIRAEKALRVVQEALRCATASNDRDEVTALAVEVEELRAALERQNQRIASMNRRTA